jgi:hypothetical protein
MKNDERCCGSGTCIIDAKGCCWCGQQWDGEKMVQQPLAKLSESDAVSAGMEPVLPERHAPEASRSGGGRDR